jgi:hypothetical protein
MIVRYSMCVRSEFRSSFAHLYDHERYEPNGPVWHVTQPYLGTYFLCSRDGATTSLVQLMDRQEIVMTSTAGLVSTDK